eukprot:4667512-Alexandrium_andersonii.AAC.1
MVRRAADRANMFELAVVEHAEAGVEPLADALGEVDLADEEWGPEPGVAHSWARSSRLPM